MFGRGTMRRLRFFLCFAFAARPTLSHLLVSSLIYEEQAFADDVVANLLAFTLPSTHAKTQRETRSTRATAPRRSSCIFRRAPRPI